MALTKISTDGFKDDAVTTDKLANAINTERTANTAKVSTTINNNADNRVITGSGTANTLNGESKLLWDGEVFGIGTTSPNVLGNDNMHTILSVIETSGTRRGQIELGDNQNADQSGIGDIHFVGHYQNSGHKDMACIKATSNGSTSGQRGSQLVFETKADGAAIAESMRINSDGDVLIGRTSTIDTSEVFGIKGPDNDHCTFGITTDGTSDQGIIAFNDDDANFRGQIAYKHSDDSMRFETAGSERMRIDSSGNVGIGTTSPIATLDVYDGTFCLTKPSGNASSRNWRFLADNAAAGNLGLQVSTAAGGSTFSNVLEIDSNGNVGIGETDISNFGGTYKGLDVAYKGSGLSGRTDNPTFDMRSNIYYDGSNYKYGEGSTSAGLLSVGGAQLTFSNAPSGTAGATATVTERMRIESGGNLVWTGQSTQYVQMTYSGDVMTVQTEGTSAGNHGMIVFRDGGGTYCGQITSHGTNHTTSYVTNSDYRLKQNEASISDGITRLKQLKPYRFEWKSSGNKVDGFFAHEAQAVVPESVIGTKDEVDSDKKPVYQGIDQSKLVPLLTAALQEAVGKIETLETKVAALEAT